MNEKKIVKNEGIKYNKSLLEIAAKMRKGSITAKQLVQESLKQINQLDKNNPQLKAIISINPKAIKIAEELDQQRLSVGVKGILYGIPVIIKDNIVTADEMPTTAGSVALANYFGNYDAKLVKKLRNAGAIILGKANLSEWANFRSIHSSSGWSSIGRQTKNPYVLDRTPCGSSSGSAVAVAANYCIAAVGTETDGSILCPAHINSVVGIKPTVGLISQDGIIPISHRQDTAGPIAQTVENAAILLSVMVESSESIKNSDPAGLGEKIPQQIPTDYTKFLDDQGLHGIRLGIVRDYCGYNHLVDNLFEQAIQKMEQAGAVIIDPINFNFPPELDDWEFELLLYEFKADLNRFLHNLPSNMPIHSLSDLISFNKEHASEILPYFGQEIFLKAQEKDDLNSNEYKKLKNKCIQATRTNGIDRILSEHQIDALVAPTANPACPIDLINGDHFTVSSTSAAAIAGYPSITVPMGYVHELPVGISFFAGAFQEPTLIKIAYAYEILTHHRNSPKFIASLEFL
ncbi:amidase [Candidatus Harpocratesius sp.]